jgi:DNA-binding IclR family transcriptional regulator
MRTAGPLEKNSSDATAAPVFPAPAVASAVRILDHLTQQSSGAGVSVIARELGLNKSTCFNILLTLQHFGLVVKSSGEARYRLGPKLVELGAAARRNLSNRSPLRRAMRDLADETGIGCVLAQVLGDGRSFVIVDRVGPRLAEDGVAPAIGKVFPLTGPAIGRAALARLEYEEALEIVQRTRGGAPNSRRDAQWRGDLARIREQGFATSLEQYERGTNAVAAAIAPHGELHAVLGLVGRATELPSDRLHVLGRRLAELTASVERAIEQGELPA